MKRTRAICLGCGELLESGLCCWLYIRYGEYGTVPKDCSRLLEYIVLTQNDGETTESDDEVKRKIRVCEGCSHFFQHTWESYVCTASQCGGEMSKKNMRISP